MAVAPGATLELLVLSARDTHCAGVDLASGALVRAWSPGPSNHQLRPYDVVGSPSTTTSTTSPTPTSRRRWSLAGPPSRSGACRGGRVERMLRRLLHPTGQPLLGESSSVVPFWERRPDQPSIAVVEPEGPITLWRERSLPGLPVRLAGPRARAAVPRPLPGRRHGPDSGAAHLAAGKGDRLLVALTPPIEGRCHKVVEAVLPRP